MSSSQNALLRTVLVAAIVLFSALPIGCGTRSDTAKNGSSMKKEKAPAPFTIEARPNSDIALNDNYVAQGSDPVEVLKGWKTRYTAPAGVANPTWWRGTKQMGSGSPFPFDEDSVGSFTVTLKGTKDGSPVSHDRNVVVGEVYAEDKLTLTKGEAYTKSEIPIAPHWIVPPQNLAAIYFDGKVSKTAASPNLSKFKWGLIQSIQLNTDAKLYPVEYKWGALPDGTTVKPAQYWYYKKIPADTNDAPKGRQLHNVDFQTKAEVPFSLGKHEQWSDTPGYKGPGFYEKYVATTPNGTEVKIDVGYYFTKANIYEATFSTWMVVFHSETKQYVPLQQENWELKWNSADQGTWNAKPLGPPATMSKPSSKSKASGETNSVDPYLAEQEGPLVTTPIKK